MCRNRFSLPGAGQGLRISERLVHGVGRIQSSTTMRTRALLVAAVRRTGSVQRPCGLYSSKPRPSRPARNPGPRRLPSARDRCPHAAARAPPAASSEAPPPAGGHRAAARVRSAPHPRRVAGRNRRRVRTSRRRRPVALRTERSTHREFSALRTLPPHKTAAAALALRNERNAALGGPLREFVRIRGALPALRFKGPSHSRWPGRPSQWHRATHAKAA